MSVSEIEMSENNVAQWQQIPLSNKNKRRAGHTTPPPTKKYTSDNRFDILSNQEAESSNQNEESKSVAPKPPPILIPHVKNITQMICELKEIIPLEDINYKASKDDQVKLVISSVESYRKTIKFLDISKISYHTYQLKQERAYRVVFKGLHHSTLIDDIKSELFKLGHVTRDITNVKSKVTKNPLSMFFVDLEPAGNNKDVYNIRHICNALLRVEPIRKTYDFVQCHRCQEFGHTKNFCRKQHICVKCGQKHATNICDKLPDSPPKCAHCSQSHTANYKGCIVYQQLVQNKKLPNTQRQNYVQPNNNNIKLNNNPDVNPFSDYDYDNDKNKHNMTYASVLKSNTENSVMSKMEAMFSKQLEMINSMMNMMSMILNKLCN